MEDNGQSSKSSSSKKTIIVSVVLGTIIIALIGVILFMVLQRDNGNEPVAEVQDSRGTVVTPDNVDEIKEKVGEPVKDGYFETRMNVDWKFATWDTASSNAYVANSRSNTREVYFDVNLKDTNELVYSSPYIPVGAELKNFALTSELSKGTYPAVVTYHLVDDEHKEISTVSVNVTLHITN